jgi:CO dehydrogenase/acetyl-CoA synthase epsilon subunit
MAEVVVKICDRSNVFINKTPQKKRRFERREMGKEKKFIRIERSMQHHA